MERVKKKVDYRQFGMMSLVVFATLISVLFDYVNTSFSAEIFATPEYWVRLLSVNASTILILLAMRSYSKNKEFEESNQILEVVGAIDNAYIELNNRNLNTVFEKYVQEINLARKKKFYTDWLKLRLSKAKNETKKQKYIRQLHSADTDVEFLKLKYPQVTVSTIFSKVKLSRENDLVLEYEEGKAIGELLVNKALGIIGFCLLGMSVINDIKTFNAAVLLTTVFKLFQIAIAIYVGLSDGKDFVRGIMLSKLKLRLNFIQQFLEGRIKEEKPSEE